MKRNILETVTGLHAIDGAGVRLVRVLGPETVYRFDPFLMLDAFDSTDPADYTKGFPAHPHRGIETFTYLMEGEIAHSDSLGNKGVIYSGECQWMTAGNGIIHEEMPRAVKHLLGLQLWINLPRKEKMTDPKYFDITNPMIPEIEENGSLVRVVAGNYKDKNGAKGYHLPATVLDISVSPEKIFTMDSNPDHTLFVYIVTGSGRFGDQDREITQKTAVLLGKGDEFTVKARAKGIRLILATAPPLGEPIAWGGPIVMNTREELEQAFDELKNGSFIRNRPAEI